MTHRLLHLLAGLGASLLLAACGGGGGDSPAAPATPPTASATASTTRAELGASVALDGSASKAARGGTLTYQWTLMAKPEGSTAALATATEAKSALVPDRSGDYRVSLVVREGTTSSDPVQLTVSATNPNPAAIVAPTVNALIGTVQLDGSASQPPDGQNRNGLQYAWTLAVPAGSKAVLDNAGLAQPRFVADVVGVYTGTLKVRHGERTSTAATVTVTVVAANAAPVARMVAITGNQTRGQRVDLDGSPSSDADGDALQYRWRLTRPTGSQAVLQNPTSAKASFTPDTAGRYGVNLTVYDGTSRSTEAGGVVTVVKPAGAANSLPVAGITAPWQKTFEVELSANVGLSYSSSYDIDLDSYIFLTPEWTLISAPAGYDAATNAKLKAAAPGFLPTHAGEYVLQLRVSDGEAWSEPVQKTFTARTGANRPPVASARLSSGSGAVMVGATVTLDGETSSDPDGNQLSYQWTLVDRPDGSTATLQNPNTARPTFVADKPGPYIASLVVVDSHGWSTAGTIAPQVVVMAKSRNTTPVARAVATVLYNAEQPFAIGERSTKDWMGLRRVHWNSFGLRANAYDPDGDTLTYLWTLAQAPANAVFKTHNGLQEDPMCTNGAYRALDWSSVEAFETAVLGYREWTCANLGLAPSVAGNYRLSLMVSDGSASIGPYIFDVPAVLRANYPSLLLEDRLLATDLAFDVAREKDATPQQRIFPYAQQQIASYPVWSYALTPGADHVIKSYRLTAFGGSYTITDLAGQAAAAGYEVKFLGLSNNQVIAQGQTVEFSVVLRVPAGQTADQLHSAGNGIEWRFRVAEKAGWTFSFKPYIYPVPM